MDVVVRRQDGHRLGRRHPVLEETYSLFNDAASSALPPPMRPRRLTGVRMEVRRTPLQLTGGIWSLSSSFTDSGTWEPSVSFAATSCCAKPPTRITYVPGSRPYADLAVSNDEMFVAVSGRQPGGAPRAAGSRDSHREARSGRWTRWHFITHHWHSKYVSASGLARDRKEEACRPTSTRARSATTGSR